MLATIERKASQALAALRRKRRVLATDYFALSQYARLLFVRNPEWTLKNGYRLFDSLVQQTPEEGVVYSVLLHQHSHQGWFVSRNRPLGMQGLFPMTTAWSGDYSGHSTDVLAYAPVERHEYMTMYAYPGQRDSGFYMCETRVPVEMESVTIAFALMASTVEGENTIYVNPGDADFYRILIEQNLSSLPFRERMLKRRAGWLMGKVTTETRYTREGDWFIPATRTRVRDTENAESLSQLRTLPYAPSFRGFYSGDESLTPEEWHAYWEGYMELSRYVYGHRFDTDMVVLDLSGKHGSSKLVYPNRTKTLSRLQ